MGDQDLFSRLLMEKGIIQYLCTQHHFFPFRKTFTKTYKLVPAMLLPVSLKEN